MAISAKQLVEREIGAKQERTAIKQIVRDLIKLYKGDIVLKNLLDMIQERERKL